MTENDAKTIDDCLKELKDHRDVYLKRSTPWRIVNRSVRLIEELKQYQAIGTVEEFKDLKEKNTPKKVAYQDEHEKCPSCGSFCVLGRYCSECGQKLDWGNE